MSKRWFHLSVLVTAVGAALALTLVGSAAAAVSQPVLANAGSNAWGGSVYLCAPGSSGRPRMFDSANLVSLLTGGYTYANSITGATSARMNDTGTAALECSVPAGATPVIASDGSGIQMVADNDGDLFPGTWAGLGTIGYPAYTG